MSNKDYTKFSNHKTEQKPVENQNGVVNIEEPVVETVVEEKVEEPIIGVVVDCTKLNVRVAPYLDADVECVIPVSSEVTINEAESVEEFYKVCTAAGIEGFCMKKYIRLN